LGENSADALIVGAGPAGIAAAIAASLKGLKVAVADPRKPPIDKPCGEGLLPEAVSALRRLGIHLTSALAFPLSGIRFVTAEGSASALLPPGAAFGLRRKALHQLLVDRATDLGVSFLWGARVPELLRGGASVDGSRFRCQWIVGADGQNSTVRKWAGLESARTQRSRFGFRRHFSVAPWTDHVEVHWGERCQLFVTPTAHDEVCVAILSHDARLRVDSALALFPSVGKKLRGARPTSPELGAVTALAKARAVVQGNVSLIGDASFSVDGIAGQGMSLAFQQAVPLSDALVGGNLRHYAAAHRRITKMPQRITRLLLEMGGRAWLRRKALRLFTRTPSVFSQAVSIHTGEIAPEELRVREIFGFGWQVLRA